MRWLRAIGRRIGRLDQSLDLEAIGRSFARHRWRILSWAVALLVALYATSGITAIGPGEAGLVERFGGYRGLLDPGLHVRFPEPIEHVIRLEPSRVRSLDIGFRRGEGGRASRCAGSPVTAEASRRAMNKTSALLLTGDGQFLEISASLHYAIDTSRPGSLRRFALGVAGPEAALQVLAESAVRQIVAGRTLLDILTVGRREAEAAATRKLEERLVCARPGHAHSRHHISGRSSSACRG